MGTHLRFSLLISCLCLVWISRSASLPSRDLLGIAPQDVGYYKSNVIKCKDGSKKFTREQLNDEFCDCPDGTDEPGTSACPDGKFYCQNAGYIPFAIFSSRVNDGICDCCDGSDEYDGNAKCPNTCWEAGRLAREKLKKKIATYQDGVTIRKQEVERAKQAFAKDEDELSKLKSEEKILKGLVEKLREHKERIETAEEEERRLREAETKANETKVSSDDYPHDDAGEAHGKSPESSTQDKKEDFADVSDYNAETEASANGAVGQVADDHESTKSGHNANDLSTNGASSHSAQQHVVENQDDTMLKSSNVDEIGTKEASHSHATEKEQGSEGLSREELGRLVASRWTGQNAAEKTNEASNNEEEHEHNHDIEDSTEEENSGYSSDSYEDRHKYDDDDEYEDDLDEDEGYHPEADESYHPDEDDKTDSSDLTAFGSSSWLDKIQQTVQNVLQAFNFLRSPVDISEGSRVRKEYDDASSKLSKVQSRISSLREKLKHDFGKEKEFYSFYDHCFENKENKYVYKVCPFKKASQVEGHSTTQLGHWEKFEESYRVMLFSNGDRCWNGPDRSLKVRLKCGLKNELTDVDEPSRCEYAAVLATPALCVEEKLKELQQKLEDMKKSQPSAHDEL